MLLIQRFYVSYAFRQLLIFAVTIEVTVTKYINFCNVIIDTVNKQINTIYKERGILSCLKGTNFLLFFSVKKYYMFLNFFGQAESKTD